MSLSTASGLSVKVNVPIHVRTGYVTHLLIHVSKHFLSSSWETCSACVCFRNRASNLNKSFKIEKFKASLEP
jgi:hypothetical protein